MKKIIITILLAALSSSALAANLFDPASGDVSIKLVSALFGGLLDAGGDNPLVSGIKAFNAGILLIGGILAAYTIFSATVNTAHEGEIFGKGYSSAWLPIRYAIGTSIVLPIVGGGYCVMQAIVMWLVVQGIGLADSVDGVVNNDNTSLINSVQVNSNGLKGSLYLAENIFTMSVCMQAGSLAAQNDSGGILGWAQNYKFQTTTIGSTVFYGDSNNNISSCGSYTLPDLVENKQSSDGKSGYVGKLGDITSELINTVDVNPIIKAKSQATTKLASDINAIAKNAVSDVSSNGPLSSDKAQAYYNQIKSASDTYNSSVISAGQSLIASMKAQNQKADWLMRGFSTVSDVFNNSSILSAVSGVAPSSAASLNADNSDDYLNKDALILNKVSKSVLQYSSNSQYLDTNTVNNTSGNGGKRTETGSSLIGKVTAAINEAATGINIYTIKDSGLHPLTQAAMIGDSLERFQTGLVGAMAILALVAGAISLIAGSGVVAAIQVITSYTSWPFNCLFVVSFVAKYLLPGMPSIIWIGCIIGWLLLVVEAVIAAPIWAIVHLHPGGQGFVSDKAANGYTLMMSLLLRPVLMVFGLKTAMVLMGLVGELVNKVFFSVFANIAGGFDGVSSIWTITGTTAIYIMIDFILIRKCMSITHKLPDEMMRWVGGGTGGLGEFAGDFASSADKGAAGVAAAALGVGKDIEGKFKSAGKGLPEDNKRNLPSEKGSGFNAQTAKENGNIASSNPNEINGDDYSDMVSNEPETHAQAQQYDAFKSGSDTVSRFGGSQDAYEAGIEKNVSDGMGFKEASIKSANSVANNAINSRLGGYTQEQQGFFNKMSFKGNDDNGNPKYHHDNAEKTFNSLDKSISEHGSDKVDNAIKSVISMNNESRSDDIKAFRDELKK